MTLVLNASDVERAATMPALIEAIEKGLHEEALGRAEAPPRLNIATDNGWFRVMPAVVNESGVMGYKAFTITNKVGARYLIAVFDTADGRLLALMDAHYLTAARTGATAGIGTKLLARQDSRLAGVIGSGLEARTNLEAVCCVRQIEQVRVFSTTPERRELFAREMSARLSVEITPVDSPQQAVQDADIVVVATNTMGKPDPVAYKGQWMQPGQHINSIASTMPRQREIDPDAMATAECILVDSKAQMEEESGDILTAMQEGKYDAGKVFELKQALIGQAPIRSRDDQITLFKSVGTAVQDVMSGLAVYKEAQRLSLGQDIGEFLDLKTS